MGAEKEAKALRKVANQQMRAALEGAQVSSMEELIMQRAFSEAPGHVLAWLGQGIQGAFLEMAKARQLHAAIGELIKRPGYENLERDLMAILNPPEAKPEEKLPERSPEEEEKAAAFIEEERRKLRGG